MSCSLLFGHHGAMAGGWVRPVSFVFSFRRRVRITQGIAAHARAASHPSPRSTYEPGLAIIVGVGPGFGYALAAQLAREGFRLVLICRNAESLSGLVADLSAHTTSVASIGCDATDEAQVSRTFKRIESEFGVPSLVVYSLQESERARTLEISVAAFESAWRHNCLGAFLVSRAAGQAMVPHSKGSIILVGSTSSHIGRAEHLSLAVGKFGQRALSQVLARELGPAGIHVAHVVIDADIHEGDCPGHLESDPNHLAYSVLAIHQQPRTAWTSELDLRHAGEQFWEHC